MKFHQPFSFQWEPYRDASLLLNSKTFETSGPSKLGCGTAKDAIGPKPSVNFLSTIWFGLLMAYSSSTCLILNLPVLTGDCIAVAP